MITALYKDDDGHIVSGVEGEGVFKITSEGNITDHLFSGKTVSSIYKDYSGNLWFGGYYSGLLYAGCQRERTFYVTGN